MSGTNPREDQDLPEAVLISQWVIPYLRGLGYEKLQTEVLIATSGGTVRADVVAYSSETGQPQVVVQVKRRLPVDVTVLDSAVQQAFSVAVALGDVRYLLVTDSIRFYWFERGVQTQSITALSTAPQATVRTTELASSQVGLIPLMDPDEYTKLLLRVVNVLRQDGLLLGLKLGLELNRLLIAKLHDESLVDTGEKSRSVSRERSDAEISHRIRELYLEAVIGYKGSDEWQVLKSLSEKAIATAVRILEPLSADSLTVGQGAFLLAAPWPSHPKEAGYTTPLPIAEFLIRVADPSPDEAIPGIPYVAPACS